MNSGKGHHILQVEGSGELPSRKFGAGFRHSKELILKQSER